MKITDLKPTIVWKFFHQVTQVPRPSKKEGKMIEFLESFAKEYKIAIKKDEAGNLLMSKPATVAFPAVGILSPHSIRMAVVFPAPLCPNSPKTPLPT